MSFRWQERKSGRGMDVLATRLSRKIKKFTRPVEISAFIDLSLSDFSLPQYHSSFAASYDAILRFEIQASGRKGTERAVTGRWSTTQSGRLLGRQ